MDFYGLSVHSDDVLGIDMRWIWLRGLGRCADHWGCLPSMAKHRGLEPIICLDLPGFGHQSHLHCPRDIDTLITGLQGELIGRVKEDEPIALMGLSLGGWVAMHWAARDPRISALVMINSSSPLSPFSSRLQWRAMLSLLVGMLRWHKTPEKLEKTIISWVSNRPNQYSQFTDAWRQVSRAYPLIPRQMIRQLRLAAVTPMLKPDQLDHCRTLILASQHDRLVSSSCSQKLADFWKADLNIHPDAGHDLSLDDPDWLIDQLMTVEDAVLPRQFCAENSIKTSLRYASLVD